MSAYTKDARARRHRTTAIFCATLLCSLYAPAALAQETLDARALLSTAELQAVWHGFASRNPEMTEIARTRGYGIGFAYDSYARKTMLGGWNGLETLARLGYADSLLMQLRLASLWTLYELDWLLVSAGVGVELFAVVFNSSIEEAIRLQPFPALRVGWTVGRFHMRAGYDYHAISSAHQFRSYVNLLGGFGVGGEISFEPLLDGKLSVNQLNALVYYAF